MAKTKGIEPVGGKNFKRVARVDSDTSEGKQSLRQAISISKKVCTKTSK